MKSIIIQVIRLRNPTFAFDPDLSGAAVLSFMWCQAWAVLRGLKWMYYGKNPKMAMLGKRVTFQHTGKIFFGKFLKLGDNVHLSALGKTGIHIGHNVGIGACSRVVVSTSFNNLGSHIAIGHNVGIGEFAYLGGGGGLTIGNECIIGQYFSCHPENHITSNLMTAIRHQGVSRKGIKVGDNCWIGSKVTLLDGVEIGAGCIIAAGAVVSKSFPENSVIGGVPARLLKSRI